MCDLSVKFCHHWCRKQKRRKHREQGAEKERLLDKKNIKIYKERHTMSTSSVCVCVCVNKITHHSPLQDNQAAQLKHTSISLYLRDRRGYHFSSLLHVLPSQNH